jgi:hypothetical protein
MVIARKPMRSFNNWDVSGTGVLVCLIVTYPLVRDETILIRYEKIMAQLQKIMDAGYNVFSIG